jgi:hypothetical protein
MRRDYLLLVHTSLMVITTALKIFIIVILCFFVAPAIDNSAAESRENREQVLVNRELMKEVGETIKSQNKMLDDTHRAAKRIHDLIDLAEKKSKQMLKDKDKGGKE